MNCSDLLRGSFCVNPETCCDCFVYPIARNFCDFLGLILATGGTNTLQQIIWWDKKMQSKFPYEQISFTNEYYDTLGIERPAGGEYRKIERVTGFRIFIPNNPQPNKAGIPSGLGNRGK